MPTSLLSPALRRQLSYRKFAGPSCTALVFDSGYHCQAELAAGLTALGHRVVGVAVSGPHGVRTPGEAMRALLQALVRHRPDLVVSVNHIGFDADGAMGQLLDALEVPVAVWYVDSPLFIHEGFFLAAPQMTTVWSWERAYLPLLRQLGARDAHHLPLACQPERFAEGLATPGAPAADLAPRDAERPAARDGDGDGDGDGRGASINANRDRDSDDDRHGITFVGSSLADKSGPWWRQLSPEEVVDCRRQARALAAGQDLIAALGRPRPSPDRRMTLMAQACLEATADRRQRLLAGLAPLPLRLVGDAGWRRRLPAASWRPPVGYGAALARLYRQAPINLNITSLQMPTAVNQRLFDVPIAGGFVLTDRQPEQAELFEEGALATFEGPHDLAEQASFYLARPRLRRQIALRARAEVLARHTYVHRAQTLVAHMRERWRA